MSDRAVVFCNKCGFMGELPYTNRPPGYWHDGCNYSATPSPPTTEEKREEMRQWLRDRGIDPAQFE